MEVEFKFKIGQWLRVKEEFDTSSNRRSIFVVERMAHECPGGIQYSYGFRGFRPQSGESFVYWMNEIEVEEVGKPKGDAV